MVFTISSCIVFLANMYMYYNINRSMGVIDQVYNSNVSLNELLTSLNDVQNYVYEYLNTKSSDSLENYYLGQQNYRVLIESLNHKIMDNDMIMMQKNIKSMSETYLKITEEAVKAKRGRNIERYMVNYEKATEVFQYINTYINSLNNEQFQYNSGNYKQLLMSLRVLEIISIAVLLLITTFNVGLIIIVTRSITEPLTKLTRAAHEVAKGNFEVDLVQSDSSDEIEIVTKAFNNMIVSIHQYIIKIKESMELESKMHEKQLIMTNHLKDAQLKYLQAQINPHFLFNTLNAGAQLAMMEGADKTCSYIENMADFFRFNMKSIQQDSTIGDEIKLVDSYIYILNVRFSGKIHFYKEIDETLLDVRVPSMIIQPIVENAVNHGIREIDYEGEIRMQVFCRENMIHIAVLDNGMGMEQETIEKIMHVKLNEMPSLNERNITKDSNGIGLGNVINRLRLYYEREEILQIESEGMNKGTKVTILVPQTAKNKIG
ncbi:sensor histidine kinase [Anaeromicropila populeti]|uniref:Histidine kinase-, DNA gyrase B-, and HSP90-like ATPase n=1 Tax=Anaeromicropila populeti TaxID=37658 RepID=A0A1I6JZY8_9FIRM|nr:histidine kinase [Anaeromicropila populeti]SFR84543.1 Histidine kinase-, DNA gyrase B-, and HSP90-like ATPase [Anaeromicropila populeti]